ncbi:MULTISPECIES: ammonium transporter [Rhodococcus]|jgi:Amt family ammonium transporter|uniref:Ammonium transporter n=1 Tax=Rhodococcus aetherivorans TaxID=191292 RepID=A0A5M3YF88_9NOCA|nr:MULTISPECIES: ammonium transporter [Rhodococcus]ETT29099.1 ammonium transporter [Rhodococcus rhodochrous ATCC 21198]AKE89664.1 ammonia channel protein [Rhodococcus aetherivorans]ANZ25623.1 ammonia channel protein [Rhodococcus sp. WB1]MBC2587105.1 ammonium transporter [Rhodococcus aetherivorans]MDV6291553.1 ammonium transporter [Rhodococcus aetherivorans]
MEEAIAAADTAWILAAFTAVSLMVPGLALFYGGMVSVRSTLNMIMMTFAGFALVGVLWVLFGYSAVLGNSLGGAGLLGNPLEYLGLGQLLEAPAEPGLPPALIAGFQLLFAGITVALVCGALADRMKFSAWMVFAGLWAVLVYFPVAHWVFAFDSEDGSVVGGWIANTLGAVDFAGGTAVHINAGIAALAVIIVLGKRRSFLNPPRPHSLPLTVLGAGILFFGWFGFNGGSALAADNNASVVVLNTIAASCAGICGWLIVEKLREGHATTLGAASGLIAALVAITPACGAVSPLGALVVGALAGALCCFAISLKFRLGYDDALDVVGIHLVGGVLGTLLIGLLAVPEAPSGAAGLFYGGGIGLLGTQTVAVLAVLAYSFVVTWIIAKGLDLVMGLRVDPEAEYEGLDVVVHGETAYVLDAVGFTGTSRTEAASVAEAATALTSKAAAEKL